MESALFNSPGSTAQGQPGLLAIVGDVGRQTIRLGLTDHAGELRTDTIRAYPSATQSTISGALTTFARECGLASLPRRCALALSGAPRGDTIWMIQTHPINNVFQGKAVRVAR